MKLPHARTEARTTKRTPPPSGILVVDKPRGPTSHDVVAMARRAIGTRHIGHTGTLDPMATGVLVLAVEEATKLVPWLTNDDKAYEATVRLGMTTDTLDAEGRVTEESSLPEPVARALLALEGRSSPPAEGALDEPLRSACALEGSRTEQVPPAFSAIHVDGERAHELARRGEQVVLPPRPVSVRGLSILGGGTTPEPHLRLRLDVGKGYFVRSFARDFARALGTVGHLTDLRRTRAGAFSLADAIALPPPAGTTQEDLRGRILRLDDVATRALPMSVLSERGVAHARCGKKIAPEDLLAPHLVPSAWLDGEGHLIAIGQAAETGEGRVLRGFAPR